MSQNWHQCIFWCRVVEGIIGWLGKLSLHGYRVDEPDLAQL